MACEKDNSAHCQNCSTKRLKRRLSVGPAANAVTGGRGTAVARDDERTSSRSSSSASCFKILQVACDLLEKMM